MHHCALIAQFHLLWYNRPVNQIKKQTLFFFFFVSLIFIGGLPHVADAASIACQKIQGDTGVIYSTVINAKGVQVSVPNGGQTFFEGLDANVVNGLSNEVGKPVYLAPNIMAPCAEKVDKTVYLKGWVWNDNIGWISLYCPGDGGTNRGIPCGFVKYGVNIDPAGDFFGYAWSSIGWIRMNCKITPGFGDVDICGASNFKVSANAVGGQTYRQTGPNNFAWSDSVGWIKLNGIQIPWDTIKDVIVIPVDPPVKPECTTGGKANPDICLREEDYIPDDIPTGPEMLPSDVVLTPKDVIPGDDFPVTWNRIRYMGNTNSSSDVKGLNPVTQADVRNLIYRNVVKWKKVASTSCGEGDYITKFTATDEVFYCKGDVYLDTVNNWKGNKTIIVEDGDVHIKGDLYSTSGQIGIIALRSKISSGLKGNIRIYPDVRELRVQMYADGYVLPANKDGNLPSLADDYSINGGGPKNQTLFGQLYIRGMIVSGNSGSYKGEGGDVTPMDLSSLRSVPADPFDYAPIAWKDYFNAVSEPVPGEQPSVAGTAVKGEYKVDKFLPVPVDDIYTYDEEGEPIYVPVKDASGKPVYQKDPNTGKTKVSNQKQKKTFVPATKLSPSKIVELKAKKIPKTDIIKGDSTIYDQGVIIQFEPPASTLAGFEGVLGNAYRQTR